MNRRTYIALRAASVLLCTPLASAGWTLTSSSYVPFNSSCSQANFQFWDGYTFAGMPSFYSWPQGNAYPCALVVNGDSSGTSVARAALVAVGDMMQGSAVASSTSSSVSASMTGDSLNAEYWVYVGSCTPWVWLAEGRCRVAGRSLGSAQASGIAELTTNLGSITASVDVTGPGETFDIDRRKLSTTGWFQVGGFSFQEYTWGSVSASAVGAGSVGRAELRAEVYVVAGLFEDCSSYRGPIVH